MTLDSFATFTHAAKLRGRSFDSAGSFEPAALRMTVHNFQDDFRENNPQQNLGAMA